MAERIIPHAVFLFIGSGLVLSLPFLSAAQGVEPASYRFYGGLGLYTSEYNQFQPIRSRSTFPVQVF